MDSVVIQLVISLSILIVSFILIIRTKEQILSLKEIITSLSYDNIFIISIFIILCLFCIQITTPFVDIIKGTVEPFLIISLTIILIDATLSLLSFTYFMTKNNVEEKLRNYLEKEHQEKIIHKSPKEIKSTIFDCMNSIKEKIVKLEEKAIEHDKIAKEFNIECESIIDDKNTLANKFLELNESGGSEDNNSLELDELKNEEKVISKRIEKNKKVHLNLNDCEAKLIKEIENIANKVIVVSLLDDFYRTNLIKKSGEFFFMSTVLLIVGILFLGVFLGLITYFGFLLTSGPLYQTPLYLLYSYSLGWIILAILIFFRGLVTFLRSFSNIGVVEDIQISKLESMRSSMISAKDYWKKKYNKQESYLID